MEKSINPFTDREDQIIQHCLKTNKGRVFDAIKKASVLLGRSYNSVYSRYYTKKKYKPQIEIKMSPIQEIFFKRDMLSKAKFDIWMELNRERLIQGENERERLLDQRTGQRVGPNAEGDFKKPLHGETVKLPNHGIRHGEQLSSK